MQDLKVVGLEDGALVVAAEDGARFAIAIDDRLRALVKQSTSDQGSSPRPSPREIQAHIRSGMSAEDVAAMTGASIDYIGKFEGPVLAEREYVVRAALSVPVHTAMDSEAGDEGQTFGTVIGERLRALGAADERWASWKEIGGEGDWVVKLSFEAEGVERDARWAFEPKKTTLAPLNSEAKALSQQGEPAGTLIPRLRAVDKDERTPDSSRFDSGAFLPVDSSQLDTAPHLEPVPYGRTSSPETLEAAVNRAPMASGAESRQTADLLEALRRRRGEREAASFEDDDDDEEGGGVMRIVDVPLDDPSDEILPPTAPQPVVAKPGKKGRATIPSWDEIVFGARSEDD